jgi:hypothetical protein
MVPDLFAERAQSFFVKQHTIDGKKLAVSCDALFSQ